MVKLLVATHNQGKVKEYAEMLADLEAEWVGLADLGIDLEVEETGRTFAENAVLKATVYARECGCLTLADDSGLEVDALDGRPGVHTARFGGPGLSPVERYQHLLAVMQDIPEEQRTARFKCVIALARPEELLGTAIGICPGRIAHAPAGNGGFGYDPVFYLPDHGCTMAELPAGVKHQISHRGRALRAIAPLLQKATQRI